MRGQGGEGKTTLAAEFARWMVRSHQTRRAAFVSVETHSNAAAVLDAIGGQLVAGYSVATFDDLEKAIHPIEQVLTEQSTLLVVDNMESILLPPFLETPEALSAEAGQELKAILAVCERLLKVGDTRIVFTSREALPAPFDADRHRRELHRLDREDAVKLVERALNADGAGAGATLDAARESIEALVDAVHGHARTLALLAPSLRNQGVDATRAGDRGTDGRDGEAVPRQPGALPLRQRGAFPPPHVVREPGQGAAYSACSTAEWIWTCSAR